MFYILLTYQIFLQVIKTQNDTLKNDTKVLDHIKKQLKFLSEITSCWNLCINHIKSLDKISVVDVKSVPENLFEVMIDALSHCKNR